MKVAVIGGGAAGFFAAISAKTHHPDAYVAIMEKSNKVLSKVKVSGGGRCNVTNGTTSISELVHAYPRGGKKLKKVFGQFSTTDTREWFESRGVKLKVEDDGRVFPTTDDSQTIIDCLMNEIDKLGIEIKLQSPISTVDDLSSYDKIIVATGGSPKRSGLEWLEKLGHDIENPVPSLFTFNMPKEPVGDLMGITVQNTLTSIQGTKLEADGPLLITHWGMSGPAILKLSAFGARDLAKMNYQFKVQVNWTGEKNDEIVRQSLREISTENKNKNLGNIKPFELPERLWNHLIEKSELTTDKKWGDLGKKGLNKLTTTLTNDEYDVRGKTTFKEEFVTCGGVSLNSVNLKTMRSKSDERLYFAGEVLDIDAITGGYNFQAAWSTGYIAGKLS